MDGSEITGKLFTKIVRGLPSGFSGSKNSGPNAQRLARQL